MPSAVQKQREIVALCKDCDTIEIVTRRESGLRQPRCRFLILGLSLALERTDTPCQRNAIRVVKDGRKARRYASFQVI